MPLRMYIKFHWREKCVDDGSEQKEKVEGNSKSLKMHIVYLLYPTLIFFVNPSISSLQSSRSENHLDVWNRNETLCIILKKKALTLCFPPSLFLTFLPFLI